MGCEHATSVQQAEAAAGEYEVDVVQAEVREHAQVQVEA